MLNVLGRPARVCDGTTRRQVLQAGGAGLLGLSVPKLLQAEEELPFRNARAKSVIFLFCFGGPSQLETFDMKPDAPEEIRGPFKPVACRTPGLLISEPLSRCAAVSDKFAVIKTMTHDFNDHSGGGHYIQTGHRWQIPIGGGFNVTPNDWPAMGSVVKHFSQQVPNDSTREMSPYVVVPNFLGRLQDYRVQLRRPGETAGWLGRAFDPLNTRIDKKDAKDNPYWRDCADDELNYQIQGLEARADVTLDRLDQRKSLLQQLDDQRRLAEEYGSVQAYDKFRQQALELVTSEKTRNAFDIRKEPGKLRDQYGRNLFGQSTLVARRLVEAGARFVTVHYDCVDGYSWDSHQHSDDVQKHLLPGLDQALSSLLVDLDDRGLLDETLVVAMGEMGRTPKANAKWGRNHWSTLFPAVLAGAGIRGGMIYGETDKDAAYAVSNPVSPEDLAATIYHALGIDPEARIIDAQRRPVPIVDGGKPVLELFG
ncbi:MAG: DUF1501 domain-containing protein [Planctomycetes bacterium]|nr:DUF1501 domain-containing protein [Planctomycetota bacterium]